MKRGEERRKFVRLEIPIDLKYLAGKNPVQKEVTTKDLSCEGLRFTSAEALDEGSGLKLNLDIPNASNPVHISAKVAWVKRVSTEDGSPFDIGVEFTKIEEDNKNTFLKYLCNLIYGQTRMMEGRKKVDKE